jgi:hypothetical protein
MLALMQKLTWRHGMLASDERQPSLHVYITSFTTAFTCDIKTNYESGGNDKTN